MATSPLRAFPFELAQPRLSYEDIDALQASGMNSLRRGHEAGRIGTDINARQAQEANLRATGDVAAADAQRKAVQALQLRPSIYAPPVQRLEPIGGAGDALSWAPVPTLGVELLGFSSAASIARPSAIRSTWPGRRRGWFRRDKVPVAQPA